MELQRTRDSKRIVSPRPMASGRNSSSPSNRLRNVAYEYVTMQSEGAVGEELRIETEGKLANSSIDVDQEAAG